MRCHTRPVLAVLVVGLLLSGSLPGYLASASPANYPAAAPQTLQSSVVVRPNPQVAAASDNPAAYAADRYVVSFRNDVPDPAASGSTPTSPSSTPGWTPPIPI
jgi:hypothetical protein